MSEETVKHRFIFVEGVIIGHKKGKSKKKAENGSDIITKFDQIPNTFTDVDAWPLCINLKCWFCDLNFRTLPIPIGASICQDEAKDKIAVEGIACSFSCAYAYILQKYHNFSSQKYDKIEILKTIYRMITTKECMNFIESPPRTLREEYGGTMSTKDYIEAVQRNDEMINIS